MQNINKFNLLKWKLVTLFYFKCWFNHVGNHTIIFDPMRIDQPNSITLYDNVFISNGSWLIGNNKRKETLIIHDGVNIGNYTHIVALNHVEIEKSVLIADKVFITDSTHMYDDISMPIKNQDMKVLSDVIIGEESWIGENVCILGCSVGRHCTIGAGSIVTHDIPDYSIAVGNPARIIKRYDNQKGEWINCL